MPTPKTPNPPPTPAPNTPIPLPGVPLPPGDPAAAKKKAKDKAKAKAPAPATTGDTPAAAKPYKVFKQPPFDPRIYKRHVVTRGSAPADPSGAVIGALGGRDVNPSAKGELTRGKIKQEKAFDGWDTTAEVNFLYNPSEIIVNYGMQTDADTLASLAYPNPDDDAQLNIILAQQVDLELLFDRSYELWDKSYLDKDVGKYGCQMDVLACKQLVGMTAGVAVKDPNKTNPDPDKTITQLNNALDVMRPTRAYAIIGGRGAVTFFGLITAMTVTYTHWNQYMVPMRCVVSFSMNLLPSGSSTGKTLGGSDHGQLTVSSGNAAIAQGAAEGALTAAQKALAKANGAPAGTTPAAPAKPTTPAQRAGR